MHDVKVALDQKEDEARKMLLLVSEASTLSDGIVKSALMKSSYILLLYNIIESTISMVMEKIHDEISLSSYRLLSPSIRGIWAKYYFTHQSANKHSEHLEGTVNTTLSFPILSEYRNHVNMYSGNLDVKKINELFKPYGIQGLTIRQEDRDRVLTIKNRRNKVAHGQVSFKECCRDLTYREIEAMGTSTFLMLRDAIKHADHFISNKGYSSGGS